MKTIRADIQALVNDNPNDSILGDKVRQYMWDLNEYERFIILQRNK